MELAHVATLAGKELRAAGRNRWFLLFAAGFAAVALGMSSLRLAGAAGSGFADLGRTAASLVHLVLLVVPLMGLVLAAPTLAGERERGALVALMALPVSRAEIVLGKLTGLCLAVGASLLVGFGAAGAAIARRAGAGDVVPYLAFVALSLLLAAVSVSLGLAISAWTSRAPVAVGAALGAWLLLVLVSELGLAGSALLLRLEAGQLLALAVLHPLEAFKIASFAVLRGGLEALGPAGLHAERTLGAWLLPALVGSLLAWGVAPAAATVWGLRRRGAV